MTVDVFISDLFTECEWNEEMSLKDFCNSSSFYNITKFIMQNIFLNQFFISFVTV